MRSRRWRREGVEQRRRCSVPLLEVLGGVFFLFFLFLFFVDIVEESADLVDKVIDGVGDVLCELWLRGEPRYPEPRDPATAPAPDSPTSSTAKRTPPSSRDRARTSWREATCYRHPARPASGTSRRNADAVSSDGARDRVAGRGTNKLAEVAGNGGHVELGEVIELQIRQELHGAVALEPVTSWR